MATPLQLSLSTGVARFARGESCKVTSYSIYNPNTGAAYVQLFDTLIAPTVGTTVAKWSIGVPAGATVPLTDADAYFRDGLWAAATTGTSTGATASAVDVSFGIS